MPEGKVFIDTNIIIYAYDISSGTKHEIAKKILVNLWNSGLGVLSTQVLQEFFVNVTQKIPKVLNLDTAKDVVNDFLQWDAVINDGESILEAIEIHKKHKYSFWDSMIIVAAIRGKCSTLLTEDLSDGQTFKEVKIKNPFIGFERN